MATLYGADLYKSPTNESNYQPGNIIGKNSEIFHSDDIVSIESTFLEVAETTDPVVGVCNKTQTMATDNQTVAAVKPGYTPIDQDYEFLMGADDNLVAANVGEYAVFLGTTGIQQVDASSCQASSTSMDVLITQVDPFHTGDTGAGSGARQCVVKFINLLNLR